MIEGQTNPIDPRFKNCGDKQTSLESKDSDYQGFLYGEVIQTQEPYSQSNLSKFLRFYVTFEPLKLECGGIN